MRDLKCPLPPFLGCLLIAAVFCCQDTAGNGRSGAGADAGQVREEQSGADAGQVREEQSGADAIPEKEIFTVTSAGRWFTSDPEELKREVDGYLAAAEKKSLSGRIVALISPHAGFVYSGPVAGWAYAQVRGMKIDTVVVVGFNHGSRPQGVAVFNRGGFRTPLGVIPVDTEMAKALIERHDVIRSNPGAFSGWGGGEHSLDNQLPFLQRALGSFKLVPVLLCSQSRENIEALADAMAEAAAGKKVLLVASSDMSHFWSHEEARVLDREVLNEILAMNPDGIQEVLEDDLTGRRLCGRGAVQAVMKAAMNLGADQAHLLRYADSQDTTGQDSGRGVVGYSAVVFTDSKSNVRSAETPSGDAPSGKGASLEEGELDGDDRARLLEIARESLEAYVGDGKRIAFEPDRPNLERKRGVFVTLKKNGRLRGCMGHFENDTALREIVARQVLVSATQDPRFQAVRKEELREITIEISVLSVPQPVKTCEEIQVGLHGVILRKQGRGATFLPQVATEQGWDREEMLDHLASKAGLPPDGWREDASFWIYTAQVFGEKD